MFILFFLVFLVFLGLKLAKKIDWSWWWVTSPLWIFAILTILSLIGLFGTLAVMN